MTHFDVVETFAASGKFGVLVSTGVFVMTKSFRLALTLAALIGAAPLLSACHTTAGVGQDLAQGGTALKNTANANAPNSPQ
jgi:predicted small secreted protein